MKGGGRETVVAGLREQIIESAKSRRSSSWSEHPVFADSVEEKQLNIGVDAYGGDLTVMDILVPLVPVSPTHLSGQTSAHAVTHHTVECVWVEHQKELSSNGRETDFYQVGIGPRDTPFDKTPQGTSFEGLLVLQEEREARFKAEMERLSSLFIFV